MTHDLTFRERRDAAKRMQLDTIKPKPPTQEEISMTFMNVLKKFSDKLNNNTPSTSQQQQQQPREESDRDDPHRQSIELYQWQTYLDLIDLSPNAWRFFFLYLIFINDRFYKRQDTLLIEKLLDHFNVGAQQQRQERADDGNEQVLFSDKEPPAEDRIDTETSPTVPVQDDTTFRNAVITSVVITFQAVDENGEQIYHVVKNDSLN